MALDPREVALLVALDAGLQFGVHPKDELVVQSAISCGYVVRDRSVRPEKLKRFAHDGDVPYSIALTEEGKRVVQLIKNELANIGILDINESRPVPTKPIDVTPKRARIARK